MPIPYLTSHQLQNIPYIQHGFFGRIGGVSQGYFGTLNTGLEKGDIDSHVLENRDRIADQFGLRKENLILLRQEHTNVVHKILGSELFKREIPIGDGFVTDSPNFLLGIQTADCVPLLLADKSKPIIGAAHAGWKGAIGGVIENTVNAMVDLGSRVDNIIAAIGPCIWQDSYEVTLEFLGNFKNTPQFFKSGRDTDHHQFDLPGYVEYRLQEIGILSISSSPADTYKNSEQFFSYRRKTIRGEEKMGNQVSVICLKST
jgi:YfiH family protein